MSRDGNGRFAQGNTIASQGGKARAEKLPAWRRREIAQRGFQTMVVKHFNGDRAAATSWLAKAGQFAQDVAARAGNWRYQCPDPGPHPAHRQQESEEAQQELGLPDSWYS